MDTPLVSVIIPTYNYAHFLSEAIQSVCDQTFRDFEIIVVDGGSTDNTREVVDRFGSRVRYIYQENLGPIVARNTGIEAARGEYLAFLDADDYWLPQKLERQVALMNERPQVALVYSTIYQFESKSGAIVGEYPVSKCRQGHVLRDLYLSCFVPSPTPMVRKSVLTEVGCFDESIRYGSEDWELWMRVAARYELAFVPEPLAMYRYHASHRSKEGYLKREQQTLEVIEKAARLFPEELGSLRRRKLSMYLEDVGWYLMRQGERAEGLARLKRAIRCAPWRRRPYVLLVAGALGPRLSPERSRQAKVNYFTAKHSLFNHQYRQARKEFFKSICLDPVTHPKAYVGLILSFLRGKWVDNVRSRIGADRYLTTTVPDQDGAFDQW
ncbi:MAG: family 2 glycosyl transferase [Acidobacteria bacterium]|nr:MAG: family 2 glycosyl transferase [Acidobacteriota bacterium]